LNPFYIRLAFVLELDHCWHTRLFSQYAVDYELLGSKYSDRLLPQTTMYLNTRDRFKLIDTHLARLSGPIRNGISMLRLTNEHAQLTLNAWQEDQTSAAAAEPGGLQTFWDYITCSNETSAFITDVYMQHLRHLDEENISIQANVILLIRTLDDILEGLHNAEARFGLDDNIVGMYSSCKRDTCIGIWLKHNKQAHQQTVHLRPKQFHPILTYGLQLQSTALTVSNIITSPSPPNKSNSSLQHSTSSAISRQNLCPST